VTGEVDDQADSRIFEFGGGGQSIGCFVVEQTVEPGDKMFGIAGPHAGGRCIISAC
jgi:hypothetical protein